MRPRKNTQPTKGLTYFLASLALHMFLGGLLIYLYVGLQPQKREELPNPARAATASEKNPIVSQATPSSLRGKPPLPAASALENRGGALKKDEENEALKGGARTENPRPATPMRKDGLTTLSRSRPGKESSRQKRKVAEKSQVDNSLRSSASSSRQQPVEPIAAGAGITRAQFTTGIKQREPEPIDRVGPVIPAKSEGIKQLYYFTEVKGMKGETIVHRWEHEGRVIAKVPLHIGSNLWRTYSSKNLTPAMTGDWRVVVTDSQGHPIHSGHFVYKMP